MSASLRTVVLYGPIISSLLQLHNSKPPVTFPYGLILMLSFMAYLGHFAHTVA